MANLSEGLGISLCLLKATCFPGDKDTKGENIKFSIGDAFKFGVDGDASSTSASGSA